MITSFRQLRNLLRGNHRSPQPRPASPARKPAAQVTLLQTSRTRGGGVVIPAGSVGRVVGSYDAGLIAAFGGTLVRLPNGAAWWEVGR